MLNLRNFDTSRTAAQEKRFGDTLYLASEIEVTTAFIAACLPAMRIFFRKKKERKLYSQASRERKAAAGSLVRPSEYGYGDVMLSTESDYELEEDGHSHMGERVELEQPQPQTAVQHV